MKQQNKSCAPQFLRRRKERGASILEIVIVLAMASIVTAFAVMQIAGAQNSMRLTNAARELMGWIEKARLDSLRRHPMSTAEMASVTLNSANSYTVTLDRDGDGVLDTPLTITFASTNGASFNGVTVPTTVRFNWRGRPVDSTGNLMSLSFSLKDSSNNTNPITVTSSGDTSLGSNINTSAVTVSGVSGTSNVKANVSVP